MGKSNSTMFNDQGKFLSLPGNIAKDGDIRSRLPSQRWACRHYATREYRINGTVKFSYLSKRQRNFEKARGSPGAAAERKTMTGQFQTLSRGLGFILGRQVLSITSAVARHALGRNRSPIHKNQEELIWNSEQEWASSSGVAPSSSGC